MADIKPTPGEWRAERGVDDEPERWCVVTDQGDGKAYMVAVIHNGAPGDTLDTEGVNGRLMAASKRMHEIIRDLVSLGDLPDIGQVDAIVGRAVGLLATLHGEQGSEVEVPK